MFNEELITAYLDGELTADEQAQVEQALASDARLRQMHDDLRALRTSLQALPQQTLDASFAERVLRAARQAQAPAVDAEPEVLVKTHHGHDTTVRPAQHEPLAWRVVVWTIAGLAAAVVVVLFLPKQTSEVARHLPATREAAPDVAASRAVPEQPAPSLAKDTAAPAEMRSFAAENAVESAEEGLEAATAPAPPEAAFKAAPKALMRAAPPPPSAFQA
ncbi:MAG TPA: zf-HC2 domain-containing protein, partial [Verrucomicrobiae bacterium]|nr:zf-HC2 domain-containing protein [Verrucomicrobiae bacterium]